MHLTIDTQENLSSAFTSGCCSGNLPLHTDEEIAQRHRRCRLKPSWLMAVGKATAVHACILVFFLLLHTQIQRVFPPEETIYVHFAVEPVSTEHLNQPPDGSQPPQPPVIFRAASAPLKPVPAKIVTPQKPAIQSSTRAQAPKQIALNQSPSADQAGDTDDGRDGSKASPPHFAANASSSQPASPDATIMAKPAYSHNSHPEYPSIARRRGLEGTVLLEILVKEDGSADAIRVESSSSHQILDEAAVAAAGKWRFIPGSVNGKPIAMRINVPVSFHLSGG